MTLARPPTATLPVHARRIVAWCLAALRRWWNPAAAEMAAELARGHPGRPPTITMFYAEIGVLAERIGVPFSADRDILPPLPEDWKDLPNAAVLTALRAERKLASGKQQDIDDGLALLREAIADTRRRLEEAGSGSSENHLLSGKNAAGGINHARHRNTHYRIVLALLHVRLGRALASLGGHDAEAEAAFDAARRGQPLVLSYVNQEAARFLLSRGRDGEADTALRAIRSIKTMAADIELAVAQTGIASASLDYATSHGEQRKLLPRLEAMAAELARIVASEDPATRDIVADLKAWQAKGLADQARLLAELGEHARAARMFETSGALYAADTRLLGSAMVLGEWRGDEEVALGAAALGYSWGLQHWRDAKCPANQRLQAMQLAGKRALTSLSGPAATPVAAYAVEFAGERGGPCVAMTLQRADDALLGNPAITQRLRLVFDAMLRTPQSMRGTRDLALALLNLFARDVPAYDFSEGGTGERIIRPWLQGIRLELDIGLLGPTQDPSAVLIARAKRTREALQAAWGVQLPGVRMSDSAFGKRGYAISLVGDIVEAAEIAASANAAGAPAKKPARAKRAHAPAPEPENTSPDTLAPDAERVFERLEAAVAGGLSVVVGHSQLSWLLQHYRQLPREDELDLDEAESAASMTALLAVVRGLLRHRISLLAFPDFYRCLRTGIAAGKTRDAIVEDIRHLPAVSADLWGDDPGRALFRFSSADTARIGRILAAGDPASGTWLLETFKTLVAGLPVNACLVVPDRALRGPVQTLAFRCRSDLPVLSTGELSNVGLSDAKLLPLPEQIAATPLPIQAAPPPVRPAAGLRRLVEHEAARRGLGRAEVHTVFGEAAAAARRGEDADYAAELALDRFGPNSVKLLAGPAAFKHIENWAAAARLDTFRLSIYRPTGVLLPPIRLQLLDALPPDAWKICFNTRFVVMPPSAATEPEEAIRLELLEALHIFVGNRQVERLLHRLGQDNRFAKDNRLLPANVLELYRMPQMVAFLRKLVEQRRSIRSLQSIMELLLLHKGETDTERLAIIAASLRQF